MINGLVDEISFALFKSLLFDVGIVNKIIEVISKELNVNMKSISFEANDSLFEGRIHVLVYDTEHLDILMRKFRQVEGVKRYDTKED